MKGFLALEKSVFFYVRKKTENHQLRLDLHF